MGFFVSNAGPLIQSGNFIAHVGEANMAIAGTNAIVSILKLHSIFWCCD